MERREFLRLAGMSALSGISILSGCAPSAERTTYPTSSDNALPLSLRIAPVKLELSPKQIIQTVGYNGSAPGPLIRVKEGQQVVVNVRNDTAFQSLSTGMACTCRQKWTAPWKKERRWSSRAQRGNIPLRPGLVEPAGITLTSPPVKIYAVVFTLDNLDFSISNQRATLGITIEKFFSPRINGNRNLSVCRTSARVRRQITAWKSCITPPLSTIKPSAMANRSA